MPYTQDIIYPQISHDLRAVVTTLATDSIFTAPKSMEVNPYVAQTNVLLGSLALSCLYLLKTDIARTETAQPTPTGETQAAGKAATVSEPTHLKPCVGRSGSSCRPEVIPVQPLSAEPQAPKTLRPEAPSTPSGEGSTAKQTEAPSSQSGESPTAKQTPVSESTTAPENPPIQTVEDFDPKELIVLPVGINVGKRNVISSALIRGLEDGSQAVGFDHWLVSLNDVVKALKFNITPLDDGQLELKSPGLVVRIDPKELQQDPEIGLAFRIEQIQTLLDVPAKFDLIEYAIQLDPPWLSTSGSKGQKQNQQPIITEGLPHVESENWTLTAVGQEINTTGGTSSTNFEGQFTSAGTILGGSWFIRTKQSDLRDPGTWTLSEAQYLRQTDAADYVLGAQSTFWPAQGDGDFWGFTTVRRWGYSPAVTSSTGGFSPSQRLQADVVGRTITGEAEPNTLVRLIEGQRDNILAETLVDSSGIYRFEDVPAKGGRYEVLLYPNGRLTAEPEVREATFSTLPSQLPAGASALVLSAGLGRESGSSSNFLGELTDWRGGIAYHVGASEDLTLGIATIYDASVLGLGQILYQPTGIPLQVAASILTGDEDGLNINANVNWQPSNNFGVNLNTDHLSSRFDINWQLFPGLTFRGSGNTRDAALQAGFTFSRNSRNFYTYISADYDTNNNFRWNFLSRLGRFEIEYRGNEASTDTELSYNLSKTSDHLLRLGYTTQISNRKDNFVYLSWSYQSPKKSSDGRNLWEFDLGYGIGSGGSGVIASAATAIVPGLVLRLRYETISVTSDANSFRVELLPFFNTQARIRPRNPNFAGLRSEGGLWIKPFLDRNGNGRQDRGEATYTEDTDLLLMLNNESIQRFRPEIYHNGVFVQTSPGTYRLDLDPSGYPLDWAPVESAYAVEVVAGSYTPVPIPFTLSYSLTGTVLDAEGQAVSGARVEAVPVKEGKKALSVTNEAGIFFLETLQQGTYKLLVNGKPMQPETLVLDENSQSFQELNLQETQPSEPIPQQRN
jgi:hypothetical protein